jgi:hypothetical protein
MVRFGKDFFEGTGVTIARNAAGEAPALPNKYSCAEL